MKKATIIFLISIFLFNSIGYFIVFKTIQYQVKSEVRSIIKNNLAEDHLVKLVINRSDLNKINWLEEDKEFSYNGNVYDVVRISVIEGAIVYSCLPDTKEEKLFENLDEQMDVMIASKSSSKNGYAKKLIKNILDNFCYEINYSTNSFDASNKIKKIEYKSFLIEDYQSSVFIPPPESRS